MDAWKLHNAYWSLVDDGYKAWYSVNRGQCSLRSRKMSESDSKYDVKLTVILFSVKGRSGCHITKRVSHCAILTSIVSLTLPQIRPARSGRDEAKVSTIVENSRTDWRTEYIRVAILRPFLDRLAASSLAVNCITACSGGTSLMAFSVFCSSWDNIPWKSLIAFSRMCPGPLGAREDDARTKSMVRMVA